MSGIRAHQSSDWYALVAELAKSHQQAKLSPFETETIVVCSSGVGHMLKLALAEQLGGTEGICAGINFETLPQLQARWSQSLGWPSPAQDLWHTRALTFAIADSLVKLLGKPSFNLVAHHIGPPNDQNHPGRWLSVTHRFAQILNTYCHQCPSMIRSWTAGHPVAPTGEMLSADNIWQFELWQELHNQISIPDPVTRLDQLAQIVSVSAPEPRLHLFTPFSLSDAELELLRAFANSGELHLWSLNSIVNELFKPIPQLPLVPSTIDQIGKSRALPLIERHESHGPSRQVEILREVLCGAFEADPSLEPRDVLIVSAQLDRYAHLLEVAFRPSGIDDHPGTNLRLQLATARRNTRNEVLLLLHQLLRLPASRATLEDLIALCSAPPVAAKFGFNDKDLAQIEQLLITVNVRWGIDPPHRNMFEVPVKQNTWLSGLDRLLAGLAMPSESGWIGNVLPSDSLSSSNAELIGSLAELISRVRRFIYLSSRSITVSEWVSLLREQLELFTSVSFDDSWMVNQTLAQLTTLSTQCATSGLKISRAELANVFHNLLPNSTGRPNYGTGALIATELGDLDGIPHRIICILGAEDSYHSTQMGDSLLSDDLTQVERKAQWHRALTTATERTILIYQSHSELTNEKIPLPALVRSLLEELSYNPAISIPKPHIHPLRSYDPIEFLSPEPFSFDPTAYRGACALLESPVETFSPSQLISQIEQLPAPEILEISADELVSFFNDAPAYLLKNRANLQQITRDPLPTGLPLALNGLENWAIRDRILTALTSGESLDQAVNAEWRRGSVGPQCFGMASIAAAQRTAAAIWHSASAVLASPPNPISLKIAIEGIVATANIVIHDGVILQAVASRAESKAWVKAWIYCLLASASDQDFDRVELIGTASGQNSWDRNDHSQPDACVIQIPRISVEQSTAHLKKIIRYLKLGLRRPLPLRLDLCLPIAKTLARTRGDMDPEKLRRSLRWRYNNGSFSYLKFFPEISDLLNEPAHFLPESTLFEECVRELLVPMVKISKVINV